MTEQDKKRPGQWKKLYSVTMAALLRLKSVRFKALTGIKMTSSMILLQIDGKLSAGELADMAKEVINNRR